MGIRQMQGVSAFLEYVGPHDGKRRTSCDYYSKKICNCKYSNCYLLKCVGRCYCKFYKDSRKNNNFRRINKSVSDNKSNNKNNNKKGIKVKNTNRRNRRRKQKKSKKVQTVQRVYIKKIKVRDIDSNKKYLFQIIDKGKENPKGCIYLNNSEIGGIFSGCKLNTNIQLELHGKISNIEILEINYEEKVLTSL